jgi:hypothetical protein
VIDTAKVRLLMVVRIGACYAAPLLALVVLGAQGAVWLATLLALVSLPLIAIACAVGFFFAPSIHRHPLPWAGAALAISLSSGFVVAGKAGLMLAGLVAVPATALFLLLLWRCPGRKPSANTH